MHTLTTLVASLPIRHARARERDRARPASCSSRPLLVGLPLLSAAVLLLLGPPLGPVGPLARRARVGGLLRRRRDRVRRDAAALRGRRASSTCRLGTWIDAGAFQLDAGMRLDPLSLTFVLLVTFVGTLIHIYAVAYMEHDVDRRRFFAYLNLFVAAMLILVLADSYLLLFVGWEGVGLASYLLIGFWNHNTDVRGRREEGVRRQPHRRPRPDHRARAHVRDLRRGRLRDRAQRRGRQRQPGHAHRDRAHAPAGRLRQVGAVPAAVLARRRDGRPDAGLRAHPRRDHGHRRRLPDRPVGAAVRRRADGRSWSSSSSARSRCCSGRSSAARRTTSRRRWPPRRCPRSAT